MMSDGHIYTLNHDLDNIAQKDQDAEVDDLKPKVGDSLKTKEDVEPRQAKMINDIDDILEVIREMGPAEIDAKGKPIIRRKTLIHKDDNLMKLLYQLTDAGYSPGINLETGHVTALKLEVN